MKTTIIDTEVVSEETLGYETIDTKGYEKKANEKALFKKIKSLGNKTGRELLTQALWIWYSKDNLPVKYIAIVLGAVGYFISPIDAIPDAIPVAGLLDDAGVLGAAITAVSSFLTQEAKLKAEKKVAELLGDAEVKKTEQSTETD